MYSVIDLFAGAGGLSLGFQQTKKYSIKVAFENNPVMQTTYKKNHPHVEVRGDVCNADYSEIKKKYGEIDVVIGGPPCQGFSNANRQRNHAISHNNSLVKEYIRAILELKPKAFIMENVSMLKSDVHRFYLSEKDIDLVESGAIETKKTSILLLDKIYLFDGVMDLVQSKQAMKEYLWSDFDYSELNVVYKATKNSQKLLKVLEKHEKHLTVIAKKHVLVNDKSQIRKADAEAFSLLLNYYHDKVLTPDFRKTIEPAIMYQRMLKYALEILDNNLIVDNYSLECGLSAEIRSFAVFDYLKVLLGTGDGNKGYCIKADVLNAADFGAPQKRKRFVIAGIRKDIATEVQLPQGKFEGGPYRTVHDAISDLEDVDPILKTEDDLGIQLERKDDLSDLAKDLRDSTILKNHLITKTTDIAMRRFKSLNQGENFHALADSMKINTYTDISRTQNTIYLRLDYGKPSGTVVNVRKSMWIHPVKDRAVSVREAARLQTFPDSFVFMGSKDKQYQQVGNAVPPIMAKAIAKKLANQLEKYNQTCKMADNHSKAVRSKNMSHIRSTNTKPEIAVRKYLFSQGFRYRKNVKKLPGCPDIVLPKYKTVIFVNGCFWHKHDCSKFVWPTSNQEYWFSKIKRNVERDKKNYSLLKSQGWKVLIVWECQLNKKKFDATMDQLILDIKDN